MPVYMVGGAVRDALLGRASYDWDFALPVDTLRAARRVANQIGAAYFPLDEERNTARLILVDENGERMKLDFAELRGETLEADLRARDFTINAMAFDVRRPQELLDPLAGAADLRAKIIRACSATSFTDDPLRVLRGVRQATAFGFQIQPQTRAWMKASAAGLTRVSPERLRDELFRILSGRRVDVCIRVMERLGALPYALPELTALKDVSQSPPHHFDVWEHTLQVVAQLDRILALLAPNYDEEKSASFAFGLLTLRLGRYRQALDAHLATHLNTDRSLRPLLFLAALYHDIAKPVMRSVDEQGKIHFYGHDETGGRLAAGRAQALHLSNAEGERLQMIVRHHMRPFLLGQSGSAPTSRAIYRFFRACGAAGVDICILSLADFLGTYGASLPQEEWGKHLDLIRTLLEAWWEHPQEVVAPTPLVNGSDLIEALHLSPGPQIGKLLEAIREAQAAGQATNRAQAMELARDLLMGKSLTDL